jgi:hypothetical protein
VPSLPESQRMLRAWLHGAARCMYNGDDTRAAFIPTFCLAITVPGNAGTTLKGIAYQRRTAWKRVSSSHRCRSNFCWRYSSAPSRSLKYEVGVKNFR